MNYLKSLVFYSKAAGSDSDMLWMSRNVDFIYSCVMAARGTKADGIRKVNVFLEPVGESWSGSVRQGVADIVVPFDPGLLELGPEAFERALSGAASSALSEIASRGLLDKREAAEVAADAVASGFRYSYRFKKLRRKSDAGKFVLTIDSSFGATALSLLDEARDLRMKLFDFWPSPWLVMLKFASAKFLEDGRLEVQLHWRSGEARLRAGMQVFEASSSDCPVLEDSAVADSGVRRFLFEVP